MADTVSDLVDALVEEASFDVEPGVALRWLNRRWRTMLGRARAYRKTLSFDPTVGGDATYDAPADVVELYSLEVGGVPYARARRQDVYWNTQGRLTWTYQGETGLFYPDATDMAVSSFTLLPTPAEDDLPVTGLAALRPPALTLDADGNSLLAAFIDGHEEGLISGAMATGYQRDGNEGLAASAEGRFDRETEELRRDVLRRYRGPGPTQIRVEVR